MKSVKALEPVPIGIPLAAGLRAPRGYASAFQVHQCSKRRHRQIREKKPALAVDRDIVRSL